MSSSVTYEQNTDDEVQFLYQVVPEPALCQICSRDLTNNTLDQKHAHYQAHFDDEPRASTSAAKHSRSPSPKLSAFAKAHLLLKPRHYRTPQQDVFWYPSQTTPPPYNYTPGLITLLGSQLRKSRSTQRALLCFEDSVHIAVEGWDRGWGCGYRNFMMACSALMAQYNQPTYFPLLDVPLSPGVRNLQRWIQDAWANGFDEEGAQQLNHKLNNTTKWIGTAELWVAFTSRGIPTHLVDFDLDKKGIDILLAWIEDYFCQNAPKLNQNVHDALRGASPIIMTNKMPIVLQHSGHSRTVIGYEKCANGSSNLLVFDPSKKVPSDIREAALANARNQNMKSQPSSSSRRPNNPTHSPQGSKGAGLKRTAVSGAPQAPAKRIRSGSHPDVIVIDSDDDDVVDVTPNKGVHQREEVASDPSVSKVLKYFRVSARSLGNKKKYQILYFPLSDPLNDTERLNRRTVRSIKIS